MNASLGGMGHVIKRLTADENILLRCRKWRVAVHCLGQRVVSIPIISPRINSLINSMLLGVTNTCLK